MQAIVVREFGGADVLKAADVPDPHPGVGQVRVRVHAAGVNPYDTYMRTGAYALRPPLPYTPGSDAAGVIDEVGAGVVKVAVGDRVYVGGTAAHRGYGAYAARVICEQEQVHPLPERISFVQGAGINVPYVTAWRAVFGRAAVRPGETIFIHGASGGVGIAATQMARAAGLTVIGTASSAEGRALVAREGAHHVLNHQAEGYLDELTRLTDGQGPDVILENLANVNLDNDLTVIGRNGRVVVVGNRGRIEIDPRKTMGKDASILGMSLWNIPPDELVRIHRALAAGLAAGYLTPVAGTELPLAEAAKAHELVMAPGAKGKIVLIPEEVKSEK